MAAAASRSAVPGKDSEINELPLLTAVDLEVLAERARLGRDAAGVASEVDSAIADLDDPAGVAPYVPAIDQVAR